MKRLPDNPEDWAEYLDPGERVLWTCAPPGRAPFHWGNLMGFVVGLGLLFMGIAIISGWADGGTSGEAPPFLIGILFAIVGFSLAFVGPTFTYARRRRTRYALTDRRGIILHRLWRLRLREMPVNDTTPVEVTYGNRGMIWLGPRATASETSSAAGTGLEPGGFVFSRIPNPKQVHGLIRKIQRGEA